MKIQSSFVTSKTLLFVLWAGFVSACAAFGDSGPPEPSVAPLSERVTGTLDVEVRDEAPWEANHVKPRLYIKNNRSEALSNFKAYYYFTVDSGKTAVLEDWYTPSCAVRIESVSGNVYRLVYDFTGFTLAVGAVVPDTAGSSVGLHHSDWSNWNRTDDWSYQGVTQTFAPNGRVVVVDSTGAVIQGTGPSGTTPPPPSTLPSTGLGDQTLSISTPPAHDFRTFGAVARGVLKLKDDASLTGRAANLGWTGTPTSNSLSSWTYLYKRVKAGDLFSRPSIAIDQNSFINGDVIYGSTKQFTSPVTVTGDTETGSFDPIDAYSLRLTLGSTSGSDLTLVANSTTTLAPGRYGTLTLAAGARIKLSTGAYYFRNLSGNAPTATFELDDARGPVRVFVRQIFDYNFKVETTRASGDPNLLLAVLEAGEIGVDARFRGALWAPNADVVVEPTTEPHRGSIYAKNLKLETRAALEYVRPAALECKPRQDRIARPTACQATTLQVVGHEGVTRAIWQGQETFATGKRANATEMFRFDFSSPVSAEYAASAIHIVSTECKPDVLPPGCSHDVALEFAYATADKKSITFQNPSDPFLPGCTYALSVEGRSLSETAACLPAALVIPFQTLDTRSDGASLDYETESIRYDPKTRVITSFRVKPGVKWTADALFNAHATEFGLRAGLDQLSLAGPAKIVRGEELGFYQQLYLGVPVEGRGFRVQREPSTGFVKGATGRVIQGLAFSVQPTYSKAQALTKAKTQFANSTDDGGKLVIVSRGDGTAVGDFQLAWQFVLTNAAKTRQWIAVISATNGAILRSQSDVSRACTSGDVSQFTATGSQEQLDVPTFQKLEWDDPTLLEVDAYTNASGAAAHFLSHRRGDVEIYSQCQGQLYPQIVKLPSANNLDWDRDATLLASVQLGLESVLDYYASRPFGADGGPWLGWDGVGIVPLDVRLEDVSGSDMHFVPPSQNDHGHIGIDPVDYYAGASIESAGHEFTHGVFRTLIDGASTTWQLRAINEGFASLLGSAAEFEVRGDETSLWCFGGDENLNQSCIEDFANPNNGQAPKTYQGQYWLPEPDASTCQACKADCPATDQQCLLACELCDEHTNAGVLEHWFYSMVKGVQGSGATCDDVSVPRLSDDLGTALDLATSVLFKGVQTYLSSGQTYADIVSATTSAANEPPALSNVQKSVVAAWKRVGLGDGFAENDFIEPKRNATDVSPWLTLRWQMPAGAATEADIQIDTTPGFGSQNGAPEAEGREPIVGIDRMVEFLIGLKPKTKYFWRVRPHAATSTWADCYPVHWFTTGDVPQIDALSTPGLFDRLKPGLQPFSWRHIAGADSYKLFVGTKNTECKGNSNKVREWTVAPQLRDEGWVGRQDVDNLQPGEHYFVNILPIGPEAGDGSHASGKCFMAEFDTSELLPPPLVGPDDGKVFGYSSPHTNPYGDPPQLSWKWRAQGGPKSFELAFYERISGNTCESEAVRRETIPSPCPGRDCVVEVTTDFFPHPNPSGYCWRVVAIPERGSSSAPSEQRSFQYILPRVGGVKPGVDIGTSESLRKPGVIGSQTVKSYGKDVEFKWNPIPDVDVWGYGFKLAKWPWVGDARVVPDPIECFPEWDSACAIEPEGGILERREVQGTSTTVSGAIAGKGRYCWAVWPILNDPNAPGDRQTRVTPTLSCYTTAPAKPVFEVDNLPPDGAIPDEPITGKIHLDYVPDGQVEWSKSPKLEIEGTCDAENFVFLDFYDCVLPFSIDDPEEGETYQLIVRASNNTEPMSEPGYDEASMLWEEPLPPISFEACGDIGEDCCAGDVCDCTGGTCGNDDGVCQADTCVACGEMGDPCCRDWDDTEYCHGDDNGPWEDAMACDDGTCQQCGQEGQRCCFELFCQAADMACDDTDHCTECGGVGQPCCFAVPEQCPRGGACDETNHCASCGGIGEPCCEGEDQDPCSLQGATCKAGVCDACLPPTPNVGVPYDPAPSLPSTVLAGGVPVYNCTEDAQELLPGVGSMEIHFQAFTYIFDWDAGEWYVPALQPAPDEIAECIPGAIHGYQFYSVCDDDVSPPSDIYWHMDLVNPLDL